MFKENNLLVIRCYKKLGFSEYKRTEKSFLDPQKDVKELIWMEWIAD